MDPGRHEHPVGEWKRTSPLVIPLFVVQRIKSIASSATSTLLNVAGPAAPVYVLLSDAGINWKWRLLLSLAFSFLFLIGASVVSYWFFRYRIDDNSVSIKSGFLAKQQSDVPWSQVRAVNVTRGPLDRLFHLGHVSFDTAGSQSAEIEIPGLKIAHATRLVERARRTTSESESESEGSSLNDNGTPLESSDEETQSDGPQAVLFELTGTQLWKAAFCRGGEFIAVAKGFMSLAGLYVSLRVGFQFFIGDLDGSNLRAVFRWFMDFPKHFQVDVMHLPRIAESFFGISLLDSQPRLVAFFVLLAFLAALVFILANLLRFIEKNFGLVISHDESRLIAESGLVSKTRITVMKERVQEIACSWNLRERLLQRGKVTLKQSESDTDHMLNVPYVDIETSERLAELAYGTDAIDTSSNFNSSRFLRISRVSLYIDLANVFLVWTPILVVILATVVPYLRQFLWPYVLLLPAFGVLNAWLSWRKDGYIVGDRSVTRRTGGLVDYEVRTVRMEKVQKIAITQAIIQRMRSTCDLNVKYAVGSIYIPYLDLDSAKSMRTRVFHVVEQERLKWT